jgi:hypothetical protein
MATMAKITPKPTYHELLALGISQPHAHQLANGKKLPSLGLAQQIETATGYPAGAWSLAQEQAA